MPSKPFEINASAWFNTQQPISMQKLKGRVVILGAFQMLCPGCVTNGIPQLKKLHQMSKEAPLTVIGLHSVFEHHEAMQPHALKVFIHEYKLDFPVAVDAPGEGSIPQTMQTLNLRGTPSTIILDTNGNIRLNQLGHIDDLALGLIIGQLLAEITLVPATASGASAGMQNPPVSV